MRLVLVISFVNGHICIDENSIRETALRAYPSWVQIWGAFWLPQLQTASLWSASVPLLCALTDSQHRNIFIFSEYLLTGRSRLLFAPRKFSTKTGSRLRGTPGCTLARVRPGRCCTDIHPCWETGYISSFFSDTTQGSFGKTLTISRHEAPRQQSGSIQSIYCFREPFRLCTYFRRCSSPKPWLTDT